MKKYFNYPKQPKNNTEIIIKTANGKRITLEVPEETGLFYHNSIREENNSDRKARYHQFSLESAKYEGNDYAAPGDFEERVLDELFPEDSIEYVVNKAIKKLKPSYQDLIKALFFDNLTGKEYAERIGCAESTISEKKNKALNALKEELLKDKFFRSHFPKIKG